MTENLCAGRGFALFKGRDGSHVCATHKYDFHLQLILLQVQLALPDQPLNLVLKALLLCVRYTHKTKPKWRL